MPSFDTVMEPDLVELRNVRDQTNKEIGTRFDFKGSSAKVELTEKSAKQCELTLQADSDFQLEQVRDVLLNKLSKRGVDVRFFDLDAKTQKVGGDKVKQVLTVKSGIDAEAAKKMQGALKQSKLKVQGAIQDGKVRVTGAKRDDLQAAMQLLRKEIADLPITFDNFRD